MSERHVLQIKTCRFIFVMEVYSTKSKKIVWPIFFALVAVIIVCICLKPSEHLKNLVHKASPSSHASASSFSNSSKGTKKDGSSTISAYEIPTVTVPTTRETASASTTSVKKLSPTVASNRSTTVKTTLSSSGQTQQIGKSVITDNISYTILRVRVTKQFKNENKSKLEYWNEKADKSGNLIDNNTYVFLDLLIQNLSNQNREIPMNTVSLLSSKKGVATGRYEMRYWREGVDYSCYEFYHFNFKPQQKITCHTGFIVDMQEIASQDWNVVLDPKGSLVLPSTRYIPIVLN